MNGTMSFLWSLLLVDFDSWNTTYRIQQFSKNVLGFADLGKPLKKEVVTNLDNKNLQDLKYVWENREDLVPWATKPSDFVDTFIFDPNATETELLQYLPTVAELCEKFKRDTIFTQSLLMLIPSTFVLILLMMTKPRKHLWRKCCWGRPSCVVPVNFIDEHGRRWAYCGAFAVMTNFLLDFFDGELFWSPGNWEDADWSLKFSWIRPFILVGNVVQLGYLFYPLFACISMRRYIPANILGMGYLGCWIFLHIREIVKCPIEPDRVDEQLSADSIGRIATTVPVFLGEAALAVAFILDFCINTYNWHFQHTHQAKFAKAVTETLPLKYIQHLMTFNNPRPETVKEKLKEKLLYKKVAGFVYPPRVVCTMVVAFIMLLSTTIYNGILFDRLFAPLEAGLLDDLFGAETITDTDYNAVPSDEEGLGGLFERAPRYITGIHWCTTVSNVISFLVHVGSMLHMMRTYRTHVRQVMRGDRSWHHHINSAPANKMVTGMRYSGYQIAYLLWGYVIMFIILLILSITVTLVFIIPLTYGEAPLMLNELIIALTTALATLIITYSQVLMSKFGFLQDRGAYLALNNRHVYHVVSFFIFFFNIVVGAFSVIKRSMFSMVFGTLLLGRLDRCLLMKGFERFDAGFTAYMGMLEMDATHNHPVLKGFIYILKNEVNDSKGGHIGNGTIDGDAGKYLVLNGNPTRRIDKRIRNKWWKLITLVNNPDLIIERLHKKVQEERQKKHEIRDNVVNMIGDVGSVFVVSEVLAAASEVNVLSNTVDNLTEVVSTAF